MRTCTSTACENTTFFGRLRQNDILKKFADKQNYYLFKLKNETRFHRYKNSLAGTGKSANAFPV
jgi:hypothetical protein